MFQLKPVAGLLILHSVKCTLISYQSLTGWVIREWNKTILKRLPIQASERRFTRSRDLLWYGQDCRPVYSTGQMELAIQYGSSSELAIIDTSDLVTPKELVSGDLSLQPVQSSGAIDQSIDPVL